MKTGNVNAICKSGQSVYYIVSLQESAVVWQDNVKGFSCFSAFVS